MGNSSLLGKILLILHIIGQFPEVRLKDALDLKKNECDKLLKLLKRLELVDEEKKSFLLTEKGQNVLKYFYNDFRLDDTPLIRIQ